jgi:hypothetical protein
MVFGELAAAIDPMTRKGIALAIYFREKRDPR